MKTAWCGGLIPHEHLSYLSQGMAITVAVTNESRTSASDHLRGHHPRGLSRFWSSPQLVASILFTFPIALCATQRSKRILWGTAAAAIAVSVGAGVLASHRVALLTPWAAAANRGLFLQAF